MATAIQIPLAEYLDTSYRPDCEYIDGEIRERNLGQYEHGRLQWLLPIWFGLHEREWQVTGSSDQRMQVSPTRVRVPDLVVMKFGPQPRILTEPPLLIIEILSPDDTYTDLQERCEDYRMMGVPTMWIIDPRTRSGRMCVGDEWIAADRLEVPGTPIYVDLPKLFSQIDSQAAPQA